jgi:hypothetical protein
MIFNYVKIKRFKIFDINIYEVIFFLENLIVYFEN